MKVELVGVGGVGEAIARMASELPWVEQVVLADCNLDRARMVQNKLGDEKRFPVELIDASDKKQIECLARKYNVDLVMNAVDPRFNKEIFDATFEAGTKYYMDMAMTLSTPHPQHPYCLTGEKLGDYQFGKSVEWAEAGQLALVGMGVEPGIANVFARYASDFLLDEIEEIGIRDGANIEVRGYRFAPNFSIWTTIEECLNPPVTYEHGRWYTTEPFSGEELFEFPEGIGKIEVVNVEHEEVLMIPRWMKVKRVTFKYGLGAEFINVLKVLKMIGLDNKEKIKVNGVEVSPRDVVASCLPNPAYLGELMSGKTCAGTFVSGIKNGEKKKYYIYQVTDNEESMKRWGCQAVVTQTAVGSIIAWDMLEHGYWKGVGVLGPECFDSIPFMEKMAEYGFPYGIREDS